MASTGNSDRSADGQPPVPGPDDHLATRRTPALTPRSLTGTRNDGRGVPVPPSAGGMLVETNVGSLGATAPNRDGSILPAGAPYQLLRRLGSGAFGEVFEALAPGGVRVAVKRILRNIDHPASLSESEALDAIKGLSHPFLLKTNAYWVLDDRLVIVMELADGSLADRLEYHQSQGRAGVPPDELLPLFEQASEALDYLHTQSVSHRDVKPENILVMQGYAKVADFGLARLHEHALTVVKDAVGTPAYMAPEMWKHQVSLQSDQYSLAATYVKARLGRLLFATNVLIDMANFHVNEVPNLDPLPVPEQQVLLKALAKKPDDRYPTCLAFARALRRAVFPPPPPPEPIREGRRKVWGTVGVALACALTVGAVNWATQSRDQAKDRTGDKVKERDKQTVPEKRVAVYPKHWEPVEADEPHLIGDRQYHRRLTRTDIPGENLVAVLVAPTQADDPEPFYMLRDKVTNRVFDAAWRRVERSQSSRIDNLKQFNPDFLPEAWRRGAVNTEVKKGESGYYLTTEGAQAGVPVLGVTLPEAVLVAAELGGRLPSLDQWKKAAGALGDDTRPGPAGDPLAEAPRFFRPTWRGEFVRGQLAKRNLALGLSKGPWPVSRRTADESYCGIHQLVSNGQEWLGQDSSGQPCNLVNIPDREPNAIVAGYGANELKIATFRDFQYVRQQPWTGVDGGSATGFRIILKTQ